MLKSKFWAWCAFVLIIAVMIFTFSMRPVWWCFADIFFAFMMVFCHLMALYLGRFNRFVADRLDLVALVCGILTVVALIIEFVLFQIMMP